VSVAALRISRLVWADAPVLRWVAASRLVVFGAFLVLFVLGPVGKIGPAFYDWPFQLLGAWDGVWYRHVAEHGYLLIPGRQSDPAFFPLFPILMRAVHAAGLPVPVAEALIANLSFLVAVPAFHRLGRRLVSEEVALRGAVFLAIAPMGYVFSMAYPESLLLLLGVLAVLAALDGHWRLAAVLAGLSALTRPEGALLAVVLGGIAWRTWASLDSARRGRAIAAVLAAPAAVLAFMGYLQWALGDIHAWSRAEQPWGRSFGLDGPLRAVEHLPRLLAYEPLLARDVVLLALEAALLVLAATRTALPREWVVAGAFVLVLPVFSGTFESAGRFCLVALPCYWGAGALELSPRVEKGVRAGCLCALALGALSVPFVWP
jgi:Mannosyltransferase (PIG-V)